jgi:hypothetical protein
VLGVGEEEVVGAGDVVVEREVDVVQVVHGLFQKKQKRKSPKVSALVSFTVSNSLCKGLLRKLHRPVHGGR